MSIKKCTKRKSEKQLTTLFPLFIFFLNWNWRGVVFNLKILFLVSVFMMLYAFMWYLYVMSKFSIIIFNMNCYINRACCIFNDEIYNILIFCFTLFNISCKIAFFFLKERFILIINIKS